jgi:hypothetical protein
MRTAPPGDLGQCEVVVNDVRYVREATLFAAMEQLDALLADALTLMDQTASEEIQMEARRRVIERHGRNVPRV